MKLSSRIHRHLGWLTLAGLPGPTGVAAEPPVAAPGVSFHLTARPWQPLAVPRERYLEVLEGLCRFSIRHQNDKGARVVKETAHNPAVVKKGDSFQLLTLLPNIEQSQLPTVFDNHHLPAHLLQRADVICFSIIDWETRYQRPQQIMSQFAAHGRRVFYISTSRFQPSSAAQRVAVRMIKENLYEISLAARGRMCWCSRCRCSRPRL